MEMDKQIVDRINEPFVLETYSFWKQRGLYKKTLDFFQSLPDQSLEPIVFSYCTHVYKEKGLFVDLLGESIGATEQTTKALAVSADVLWALSLMVDDVYDSDMVRGGRESCLARYGEEKTIESAQNGFISIVGYLVKNAGGKEVGNRCLEYVKMGIDSLIEHKQMTLETLPSEILRNYEKRCEFHGVFQVNSLFDSVGILDFRVRNMTIAGFRLFYRSGQLINDLKDIIQGDLYSRNYSDIRNGVSTIPIFDMYSNIGKKDKVRLKSMFGSKSLSLQDNADIRRMVEESYTMERVLERIQDGYNKGLLCLSQIIRPDLMKWLNGWSNYKISLISRYV